MKPKYADLMYQPVRYTDDEAWVYFENQWQQVHMVEVDDSARLLTEAEYLAMYPQLPPLPITAFANGQEKEE